MRLLCFVDLVVFTSSAEARYFHAALAPALGKNLDAAPAPIRLYSRLF
jgi:hypothetical protein